MFQYSPVDNLTYFLTKLIRLSIGITGLAFRPQEAGSWYDFVLKEEESILFASYFVTWFGRVPDNNTSTGNVRRTFTPAGDNFPYMAPSFCCVGSQGRIFAATFVDVNMQKFDIESGSARLLI